MFNKIKIVYKKIIIALSTQKQYQNYLKRQGVKIGKGCIIDKTANFGSEPWLIELEDNVRITRNVQFITHDGGLWTLRKLGLIDEKLVKYGRIKIGKNSNISWNSIIMPGCEIGENCVVAAGAIVTKSIPENSVVGGIPAKKIEDINEYYCKVLKSDILVSTNHKNKKYIMRQIEQAESNLVNRVKTGEEQ